MINRFRGKYSFLSNFFDSPVTYNGITYLNSEAAFQAQKTFDDRERFSYLPPASAKRLGRRVQMRKDWEIVKTDEMYKIVKAKFSQNEDLKNKLIETGDEYLEEGNTWGDRTWGTVNGVGENRLGKILMKVRKELQSGISDNKLNENSYDTVNFHEESSSIHKADLNLDNTLIKATSTKPEGWKEFREKTGNHNLVYYDPNEWEVVIEVATEYLHYKGDSKIKNVPVNISSCYYMFYGYNLEILDLSNFETSNIINMEGMFCCCMRLKELNLSNFNTSKVTNMEAMFYACANLKKLDISSFNMGNVIANGSMLAGCNNLPQSVREKIQNNR
jgi:hypothetical protein